MNRSVLVAVAVSMLAGTWALAAQQSATPDGPQFVNGRLVRPTNYREWPFLGSSVGLTYVPPAGTNAPSFGNVFVNPSSYRAFMQSGKWPDGTMLVLEVRRSSEEGALIKGGRYQSDLVLLEANVKDSTLPDGWGFFSWGRGNALLDSAPPAPATASVAGEGTCVDCHIKHTAVERTFVQFYPTLMEVARRMGTVKAGF